MTGSLRRDGKQGGVAEVAGGLRFLRSLGRERPRDAVTPEAAAEQKCIRAELRML